MKSLLDKLRRNKDAPGDFSPSEQDKGGKSNSQLSIRRMILYGLAATLVIVVFVAVANYLQLKTLGSKQRDATAVAQTASAAAQLSARLQGYSDVIAAAAQAPQVVAALSSNDQDTLRQHGEQLRALLPGASGVRFLLRGEERIDTSSRPALSYACLDLARRAENQNALPPIEVHLFGSQEQHVVLVRAVPGGNGAVGVLLVTFDTKILRQWVKPLLPAAGGYIELRQGGGDNYLMVGAAGDASLQGSRPPFLAPVAGSSWTLAFWPPIAATASATGSQVAFFSGYGVALAAIIAVFITLATIVTRVVHTDLVTVVKQAIDIWSGNRQHSYEVRLAESIEILTALEQRVKEMQGRTPPVIHPDPAKAAAMQEQGIVVDEVPDDDQLPPPSVLFMDKDAMEVEEMSPPPLYSRSDEDKDKK